MSDAPHLQAPAGARPATGIVHLGLGAFFRAFGCPFIADAMAAGGGDWGVIGVSLRSPTTRDALRDQGWAYTSVALTPDGWVPRRIDVLNDVLVAPEDPGAVLRAMADPAVKIVTLTVTEKGYCHDPVTGSLDLDHPDIRHDLSQPTPVSAIGYLVRALQIRLAAGTPPFSVLSCDNLPQNGRLLRGLVLDMAQALDPALADWIAQEGRFPCAMVDRITPATTAQDIADVQALIGAFDAAPVLHEPFAQWVLEDAFVHNNRPDFAAAGVELVSDVSAHEHMKLRMLNGTHSALAYAGYLAGHETIADTVADAMFASFARALWAEISPTLTAPAGLKLPDYADALLARYANPAVRHKTWQIAMDGSQKLPQRLLGTLMDSLDAGRSAPMLCLAVAAWMRYVTGRDMRGGVIDVRDPLADTFKTVTSDARTPAEVVHALLGLRAVFTPEMAEALAEPVGAAAAAVWKTGPRQAIKDALAA